jgi:hypothetical protein
VSYGTRASKESGEPAAARSASGHAPGRLRIGAPEDACEHEADGVADEVMAGGSIKHHWSLSSIGTTAPLRRKCSCGSSADSSGQCEECRKKEEDQPAPQRKASGAASPEFAPPIVHEVLNSSGQPLDNASRDFFEPRLGYELSRVRLHADARAAESARAVGALAYTVGDHLVFGAGRLAPGTHAGRRLLAHELAHVPQQVGTLRRQPPPPPPPPVCAKSYSKAASFQALIDLVKAAEAKLTAAGITSPKDQIHAIRGIYYGTLTSLDFAVEKSATRNEGFQRFTRPSQDPSASVPPDVTGSLDCGLFKALQDSQDLVDPSGRQVDFGHLIIALDARGDPAFASNIKYPAKVGPFTKNIDLGGTGTELVTWIGDLGGGAGSLAVKRVAAPATNVSTVFTGSDYGGSINLEGDIAGSVVATGSPSAVTAPTFAPGKGLSDVLQDYLSPAAAGPAWNKRATTFLTMNGATFDGSGALSNRSALITAFANKIQEFACNYIASRVKDGKMVVAVAKSAASTHVVSSAQEVATAFVDALVDSHKSGGKIEATRFPSPSPGGTSACAVQVTAASLLAP